MRWRVIETGHDKVSGKSTIASDRFPATVPLASGNGLCQLWETGQLLGELGEARSTDFFPGPNGLRFWVFVVPPDNAATQVPALHATATADFGFVLCGTVTLTMEDGSSVTLKPGDAFVQKGTAHSWRNLTAERAALGLVVIGTDVHTESSTGSG